MVLLKDKAFINGCWAESGNGQMFEVQNPATLDAVGLVPDLTQDDVERAIGAAKAAFVVWSAMLPAKRNDILQKWADSIQKNAESLGILLTSEQGKPKAEALAEILSAVASLRWCAQEGQRLYGEFIEGPKPGTKIIVSRHPVGIVGAITPWNFPVSMVVRKIAPALAAGCTCVLKPAEATPLTALALAHLADESGLPRGVLNVVTSKNPQMVGEAFTQSPHVHKISFTGSTRTGKILMKQAATRVQKIALELGGNASFVVFPSADLKRAVEGVIASKFRNAGQTCICANRIFVHDSIYEAFLSFFMEAVSCLKVGNGLEEDVQVGPLINAQAIEKVEKMIKEARDLGARVMLGGKRKPMKGHFFEPTIVTEAPLTCSLAKEEIFGPVAAIYRFNEERDVIALCNDTPYGLSSYIYSNDAGQIWRVSDSLDCGMVAINEPFLSNDLAPFGGVKESGIGREGGKYGLMEYTYMKYRLWG